MICKLHTASTPAVIIRKVMKHEITSRGKGKPQSSEQISWPATSPAHHLDPAVRACRAPA